MRRCRALAVLAFAGPLAADARSYVVGWDGGVVMRRAGGGGDPPAGAAGSNASANLVMTNLSFPAISLASANTSFTCTEENRAICRVNDKGPASQPHYNCQRGEPQCSMSGYFNNIKGPWIPCCEKRNMWNLMVFFHNAVSPHIDPTGQNFWYSLTAGSALAAIREGQLIDWDVDLDVAAPRSHADFLLDLLQKEGQKYDPPYYVHKDADFLIRLYLSQGNQLHMDIWLSTMGPDKSPCVNLGEFEYPRIQFWPLENCRLHGQNFPCWAQSEKLLSFVYGDWHVNGTKNDQEQLPLPSNCTSGKAFLLSRKGRLFQA